MSPPWALAPVLWALLLTACVLSCEAWGGARHRGFGDNNYGIEQLPKAAPRTSRGLLSSDGDAESVGELLLLAAAAASAGGSSSPGSYGHGYYGSYSPAYYGSYPPSYGAYGDAYAAAVPATAAGDESLTLLRRRLLEADEDLLHDLMGSSSAAAAPTSTGMHYGGYGGYGYYGYPGAYGYAGGYGYEPSAASMPSEAQEAALMALARRLLMDAAAGSLDELLLPLLTPGSPAMPVGGGSYGAMGYGYGQYGYGSYGHYGLYGYGDHSSGGAAAMDLKGLMDALQSDDLMA